MVVAGCGLSAPSLGSPMGQMPPGVESKHSIDWQPKRMAEVFSVLKAEHTRKNEHMRFWVLGFCRFKNMKIHLLIQYAKKS